AAARRRRLGFMSRIAAVARAECKRRTLPETRRGPWFCPTNDRIALRARAGLRSESARRHARRDSPRHANATPPHSSPGRIVRTERKAGSLRCPPAPRGGGVSLHGQLS